MIFVNIAMMKSSPRQRYLLRAFGRIRDGLKDKAHNGEPTDVYIVLGTHTRNVLA